MSEVAIELQALEVRGFHGATDRERAEGQRFLFDVSLSAHDAGVRGDELADTVDYTAVVACILDVSGGRRFNLIEALAAAGAVGLLERLPTSRGPARAPQPAGGPG